MTDQHSATSAGYGYLVAATDALLRGELSVARLHLAVECLELQDAFGDLAPSTIGNPFLDPAVALNAAADAVHITAHPLRHLVPVLRRLAEQAARL